MINKFKGKKNKLIIKSQFNKKILFLLDNLINYLISNFVFIRHFYFLRQLRVNNKKDLKNKKYSLGIVYEERIKYLVEEFENDSNINAIIIPRILIQKIKDI